MGMTSSEEGKEETILYNKLQDVSKYDQLSHLRHFETNGNGSNFEY